MRFMTPLNFCWLPIFAIILQSALPAAAIPRKDLDTYFSWAASHANRFGDEMCTTETIAILVKLAFERQGRRGLIIDVGANLGNVAEHFLKVFSLPTFMANAGQPVAGTLDLCQDLNSGLTYYGFEPHHLLFPHLKEKLQPYSTHHQIRVLPVAVSNFSGTAQLYHGCGDVSFQGASLVKTEHLDRRGKCRYKVTVVTLDQKFYHNKVVRQSGIFLLKIDAEQNDALVLEGGWRLLRNRMVKFLIFETWLKTAHGISFQGMVAKLHSIRYVCFLVTKVALVPLSSSWWQPQYKALGVSNVLCGQSGDRDLFDAYIAYGTNNFTLFYALSNLLGDLDFVRTSLGRS